MALRGLHGNRSDAFQLCGRRAGKSGERLGAGGDDQVRPLATDGAKFAAIEGPAGELNHRVRAALPRGAVVIYLGRWHQRVERSLERRATLGVKQAFQVD